MTATKDAVSAWFVREILPLEAGLMSYLRHNWRNAGEHADLRQEIYARVYEAALENIPANPKRFLMACARNLLVDIVRHSNVVPIGTVADLDALDVPLDAPGPDRAIIAQEELQRVKDALSKLPPRAREAITLAYFEGLSGKEVARRMGVTQSTASLHIANGATILTDLLYAPQSDTGKSS